MIHYLNVCDIRGDRVQPVDIVSFGSPCQDLSVAGKRAGLKHEANGDDETTRSGLFMEAVRIIKEMRRATNGKYPTYALWENVPGAFSSNKGEDFRVVLEELAKISDPSVSVPMPPKGKWSTAGALDGDNWSIAWRTVDAQYHGVAQRRRRILLVADLTGKRAREISFKCEGLPGYPQESGEARQGAAPDAEAGTRIESGRSGAGDGRDGRLDDVAIDYLDNYGGQAEYYRGDAKVSSTLRSFQPPVTCYSLQGGGATSQNSQGSGWKEDTSYTLNTLDKHGVVYAVDMGGGKGREAVNENLSPTLVTGEVHAMAYGITSDASNSMRSGNPHSGIYEADIAKTLDLNCGNPSRNQGGIAVVEPVLASGKNAAGCLMASGYEKLGAQEMFSGDYTVLEPVCYDGVNITSPVNASNPQPGDTCHTLSTDSRNYVVERIPPTQPFTWHNHGPNARQIDDDISPTLMATMGEGGSNTTTPILLVQDTKLEPAYTLKIRGGVDVDSNGRGAGKGALIQTDLSATLGTSQDQTLFQPVGADGLDCGQVAHTLISRMSSAVGTTQDNLIVTQPVAYGLDRASFNQGTNAKYDFQILEEQQPTLTARGPGATCAEAYVTTMGNYMQVEKEKSPCLMARDYKDPNVIAFGGGVRYIVRRLTPTEYARLQGFPDDWGHLPKKDDFTDEEMDFWNDVYITYQRVINNREVEPKNKNQLLAWYNKLWTDSAEYKMWGNGVALPCVRVPVRNMAKFGARTLASLFDGSGGFPLAGVLEGITPVWCSEIEPYPIAVTVNRFPEIPTTEEDWME